MRKFLSVKLTKSIHKTVPVKNGAGFTLMEIVVATTIFALVSTAMMGLFNYTLKINRRTEALRQATQGIRTFVEGLVKQVRNGQIYYAIDGLTEAGSISGVCPAGDLNDKYYEEKENKIRIINTEGEDVCIYLANSSQTYVGNNVYSGNNLIMEKNVGGSIIKQALNPVNLSVENLAFFIRPVCNPYEDCDEDNVYTNNDPPLIQPMASIFMKIKVQLPTGEQTQIYYQTSVSSNKYDIPYD